MVGYTALMQENEKRAANLLQKFRSEIEAKNQTYNGTVANFYGDGALCLFENLEDLMQAALKMQQRFQTNPKVDVRIGLNSGIVSLKDGNVFGNAVNLASRIEAFGVAGSILISNDIQNAIKSDPSYKTTSLGKVAFKNIEEKQEVFALIDDHLIVPEKNKASGKFSSKNQKLLFAAIGFVLLTLITFLIFRNSNPDVEKINKSLAILPLENLNQNIEQEYLTDGISQDILTHLSGIKDMQIISFASSKRYRNSEKTIKEIGEELGVQHLLLGSVQQAGQRLRIRARLIDAQSDNQIWANSYDREIEDIFAIQSDVAQKIAEVLKTELSPSDSKRINQKPTNNIDAYQNFSKGRYEWEQRTKERLFKAIQYFEKAIEQDENFALAYAGLAQTYATMGSNGHLSLEEGYSKAKQNAEKAILINPNLSEAYSTIAAYYIDYDFNFEKALEYYQKSIDLNPSDATTHQWLAEAYLSKGMLVEARNEIQIAKKLNPKSLAVQMIDAFICIPEKKTKQAIDICNNLSLQFPDNEAVKLYQSKIFFEINQAKNGLELLQKIDPNQTKIDFWIFAYSKMGDYDSLKNLKEKILKLEESTQKNRLLELANFYLLIGQKNYTAAAEKLDSLIFVKKYENLLGEQIFRSPPEVRNHPRYQEMMSERGILVTQD